MRRSWNIGVCTDIRNMWDFHLQNHQHFDTFVKDFKEKRLKIKLKYEHKISHVSYVRAHPKSSSTATMSLWATFIFFYNYNFSLDIMILSCSTTIISLWATFFLHGHLYDINISHSSATTISLCHSILFHFLWRTS